MFVLKRKKAWDRRWYFIQTDGMERNVGWACEIQDPPILIVEWGPIQPILYLYAPNTFVICYLVFLIIVIENTYNNHTM